MAKKMLIDATHAEETRVVVVDGNKVEEFDFESLNKRQLAGNIYLAKVTRVEPSLQAAFVDYGGNRHGFLAFSEIHPDYYQIPVADREALLAEEKAYAEAQAAEEERRSKQPAKKRRSRSKASAAKQDDAVVTAEADEIAGMGVLEVDEDQSLDPLVDLDPSTELDETPQPDTKRAATAPADSNDADDNDADNYDGNDNDSADDTDEAAPDAAEKDADIESVAQEDEQEDIRPVRKPRPRRYKIQEVIKVRQILLIQVVKEERGNKGAALTTYLSLAGRYCVLMPNTARGGGISRKITNAADRKKLKEIAGEIEVPEGAGLIIRTAGAKRTRSEIRRDYDYLLRQWEQIRDLTLKSIAPAPIYEEGSLIKRSIRDLYNREIDEVLIEGEEGYRIAKDYMKMLMPSHAKNVKNYTDPLPLFARYQVESYLSGMFNPTVQLRSGGYIVIGVTEALVAIDVNSGRATKEGSIEETALKTNLEAAEEVARQLRLRDLAGLIVIDFIDMEDRRNNIAVEKRIKDRLKTDRARIQVGRISGFGLMEMSRQRLRPGMIEATTAPCPHCHGTGLTRSDDNLALSILRELEEEGVRHRSREVLVTVPLAIANYMLNQKREHVAMIESRYGISIRIEASAHLISPDFTIERFKTATRRVPEATAQVVSMETAMAETSEPEVVETPESEAESDDNGGKKKRRRRRRRGGRGRNNNGENGNNNDEDNAAEANQSDAETTGDAQNAATDEASDSVAAEAAVEDAPKKKSRRVSRKKAEDKSPAEPEVASNETEVAATETAAPAPAEPEVKADAEADAEPEAKPVKKRAPRKPRAKKVTEPKDEAPKGEAPKDEASQEEVAPKAPEVAEPAPTPAPAPEKEPALAEAAPEKPAKPKRRGWWNRG